MEDACPPCILEEKKPIPNLKGNEYKIRQLFNLSFGKETSQIQNS